MIVNDFSSYCHISNYSIPPLLFFSLETKNNNRKQSIDINNRANVMVGVFCCIWTMLSKYNSKNIDRSEEKQELFIYSRFDYRQMFILFSPKFLFIYSNYTNLRSHFLFLLSISIIFYLLFLLVKMMNDCFVIFLHLECLNNVFKWIIRYFFLCVNFTFLIMFFWWMIWTKENLVCFFYQKLITSCIIKVYSSEWIDLYRL